jgi:ATP-dependent exoDNAse (exonuclease V) beta subunit
VLDAIKVVTEGSEGIEHHDLKAKKIFPEADGPVLQVLTVRAADLEQAMVLEARHVAARIQELRGKRRLCSGLADYGSMAVLLRTAEQVHVFERELREREIPCQVTAGRGFYDAPEVQDLVQFLRALWNPLDEISLAAVLRSPMVGISDDTLFRLKLMSGSLIDGVRHITGLPAAEAEKVEEFRRLFNLYRSRRDYFAVDQLLNRILIETGYEAWLLAQHGDSGASQAVANVRKLITLARRFGASGAGSMQAFVERLEDLRRDQAREAEAEPPEQSSNAVQLMTIHAAKGLEFPVVFLPALNRRPPPETDPVFFSPELGIGMRWLDPVAGEPHRDSVARAIGESREAAKRKENDRLFYVAMTRAEELLILSASFGAQAKPEHWAKKLQENLEIDCERVDNTAQFVERRGVQFRLSQTDQEPLVQLAAAPAPQDIQAIRWFDRIIAGDQSDAAVSASAVTLFALCPRKYYLSRYLGFEKGGLTTTAASDEHDNSPGETEDDDTDASEFGRLVHALLARTTARENAGHEAMHLVENFEASALGRRVAQARRVEREQEFLVLLGDRGETRLLRGQIDLWFEEGGEIVVVDYKTDEVKASGAKERAQQYALQLRAYALALERIAGRRPDRAIVYLLRPDMPVEISLNSATLDAARQEIEELFRAQSSLHFPLREGQHCFQCPHFRQACPAEFAVREHVAQSAAGE